MSEPYVRDPGSPPETESGRRSINAKRVICSWNWTRSACPTRQRQPAKRLHDRSTTTSTVPRNRIHHPRLITRFAAVVTALPGAVLAFGAAAPAAFRHSAAGTRPHWRHRSGRDPHRDRRRHARREDHSDRTCGRGPRRSRGSAAGPCTRNAAAHDGAKRLKHATAALRCGCRSRPDLPVGSCRRGCRPQTPAAPSGPRRIHSITGNSGEDAGMVDLSTADDLAAR